MNNLENALERKEQIDKFYEKLKSLHKTYLPDLTFGQLIFNFVRWLDLDCGLEATFHLDEDIYLRYMEMFVEETVEKNKLCLDEEPNVDWSKVEVDTIVLVRNDWEPWHKKYFAKYDKYSGRVYVWYDGKTSQTTKIKVSYKHTKLIENKSEDNNDR